MIIVPQSFGVLTPISDGGIEELRRIERAARVCYKSEDKISPDGESAKTLVKSLIEREHYAMIEHSNLSVIFLTDRGVTHELVRHRVASYGQESTRYCNYGKGKFRNELTFIEPVWMESPNADFHQVLAWKEAMQNAENSYLRMVNHLGMSPQDARAVLPNSLKTEIIVSTNYREWRHIFDLRCAPTAHPQIRDLMTRLRDYLRINIPIVFD